MDVSFIVNVIKVFSVGKILSVSTELGVTLFKGDSKFPYVFVDKRREQEYIELANTIGNIDKLFNTTYYIETCNKLKRLVLEDIYINEQKEKEKLEYKIKNQQLKQEEIEILNKKLKEKEEEIKICYININQRQDRNGIEIDKGNKILEGLNKNTLGLIISAIIVAGTYYRVNQKEAQREEKQKIIDLLKKEEAIEVYKNKRINSNFPNKLYNTINGKSIKFIKTRDNELGYYFIGDDIRLKKDYNRLSNSRTINSISKGIKGLNRSHCELF